MTHSPRWCDPRALPLRRSRERRRIPPSDVGTAFRGVTLAINVESVALVDSTIAELREKGATITKEPHEEVWGGRSAYFTEPEGNLWEVVWAPGAFDDAGNFVWGV